MQYGKKNHAQVRLLKTIKCVFFQITLEIMPLPINNKNEKSGAVPKKLILGKLLLPFLALCYLETAPLLASQVQELFS